MISSLKLEINKKNRLKFRDACDNNARPVSSLVTTPNLICFGLITMFGSDMVVRPKHKYDIS